MILLCFVLPHLNVLRFDNIRYLYRPRQEARDSSHWNIRYKLRKAVKENQQESGPLLPGLLFLFNPSILQTQESYHVQPAQP